MLGFWLDGWSPFVSSKDDITQDISPIATYFIGGAQYKVIIKVSRYRLEKYLLKLISPIQYGFIEGRNTLLNMLNVQISMDYTWHTHQKVMTAYLDLEKSFDHINWHFVFGLMHTMGFRTRMSLFLFFMSCTERHLECLE